MGGGPLLAEQRPRTEDQQQTHQDRTKRRGRRPGNSAYAAEDQTSGKLREGRGAPGRLGRITHLRPSDSWSGEHPATRRTKP